MTIRYPRASRDSLKAGRFHDLMPHRVREVLLVSAPYDAFILEEDGQLTEQVFFEYRNVSLAAAPRFTQVSSGEAALQCLHERRYDMVLTMSSPADMDVNAFGRAVKNLRPGRPVVFLALNRHELRGAEEVIEPDAIDGAFLWTGDSEILLAIIKFVEDRENVDHDIAHGNVRVILLLEDSLRFYSSFLGILYKELMAQSHALYSDGVNEHLRHMNMKSRAKILPARSYEEGRRLFERYRRNVMAIISDVRIPRDKTLDATAGLDFVSYAKRYDPELPVLIQSAEPENRKPAQELGAFFLDKSSRHLLREIRNFLRSNLGFGDFIFRLPDGSEVARAHGLQALATKLAHVHPDSVAYHASHNHFSIWLMARSEFDLAEHLRPTRLSDFDNVEALREYLVHVIRETHRNSHRGVVSDFDQEHFDHNPFSRLGQGSLGGKARGLAFLHMSLANSKPKDFGGLAVALPKTIVLTTDWFDRFLEINELQTFAFGDQDDSEIERRFVAAHLPKDLEAQLEFIAKHLQGPLAVRSSSLLEDSLHQPFAGIYHTFMLPNNATKTSIRLEDLRNAIKMVYASTFFHNAKSYLAATGSRIEEEKMAVILQQVVGRNWNGRFYPHFAGVAQSHNFYPVGPQRPEEGIVQVALGLGRYVVDGGATLRFSPAHPGVTTPYASVKALLDNTQRTFCALDLELRDARTPEELHTTVRRYDLKDAEDDGSLALVGSVYSVDDRRVRDDLSQPGPRVVSFNNILRHRAIPLAEALEKVLEIARDGFGCAVELELACDMGDWGRRVPRGTKKRKREPKLYLLQVRPLAALARAKRHVVEMRFPREQTLCYSTQSLGHGIKSQIRDLVYVRRDGWQASDHAKIAQEVGDLNEKLGSTKRPYVLIGPGRWGTSDEWLGIPVQWSQISNAQVIIEASPEGYNVEPSQGTHFFQNLTALRLGYLTLPPGAEKTPEAQDFVDWEWLESQEPEEITLHLRHLRFAHPLTVVLNGQKGCGILAKPDAEPKDEACPPCG